MKFHQIAAKIAETPLSDQERALIPKANVFIMDWEVDGGTFPPEVQKIVDEKYGKDYAPSEARAIIKWFQETAPGDY
jgi:hypothetical protein